MASYFHLTGRRVGVLLLFGTSLLACLGVLNGLYVLDQFARAGEDLPAAFVQAKAARAMFYGGVVLLGVGAGVMLLLREWRATAP